MRDYRRPQSAPVLGILSALLGVLAGLASPAWGQATSLFFSEYVEGSGVNKALEIYNGTGAAVDLAAEAYKIQIYANGATTANVTIDLTGTIASGGVHVVAAHQGNVAILAKADQLSSELTNAGFNGNDAVALVKGTTVVDVIGEIGVNPGTEWAAAHRSTLNSTLRRRAEVCAGDPDGPFDPSIEWIGSPQDTFEGLGAHGASCVDFTALIQALRQHTHTYRTGQGAGHNNTEATTGPAFVHE